MFETIPEQHRAAAQAAVSDALGAVDSIERVRGGASGADVFRLEAGGRPYLLRLEQPRDVMRDPSRWYPAMRIAAEAGIAPPLRHADPEAGVAIMDFIPGRPLTEFPGGPVALARAQGELIARLQRTEVFPPLREYPELLAGMIEYLRVCGRYRPELFAPHLEGLARIREAYPWDPAGQVSSHNDPNPGNQIFDGERLWLVDWETSFRNDPFADVAILADQPTVTPESFQALVEAWYGSAPDASVLARLELMRLLTRLYYGALMLSVGAAAHDPQGDLSAMSPDELQAAAASGRLRVGPLETLVTVGKTVLAGFIAGMADPRFEANLATVRAG